MKMKNAAAKSPPPGKAVDKDIREYVITDKGVEAAPEPKATK